MFGVNFDITCVKNAVELIFVALHRMSKDINDFWCSSHENHCISFDVDSGAFFRAL